MDLLQRLKAETRPHHDRIEGSLDPMRAGLTRVDYLDMLRRFRGFYAAWEAAAAPLFAGPHAAFFGARRKLPLLDRDLAFFGLDGAADGDAGADALPRLDSPGRVLGSMYVLEGSTLGGQHISRHLARTLGVGPDSGGAFFASYGDRVGPMWKEFQGHLVAHAAGYEDAAVAAAGKTFDRLAAWMTPAAAA